MTDSLEFTGERFTPECVREIRYEHFHRYAFALERVRGRRVLDAACGEGYGSALLATAAAAVTGVDISGQSVAHAQQRYRLPNLAFQQADCTALPFGDGEFDVVVSFETLEHLENQRGLLAEFRRVLNPDGFLLISTPDKAVYTDQMGNCNEYHVAELYREEFEAMLGEFFPARRLWGQKLLFQSAIWSLEAQTGVQFQREDKGEMQASDQPPHAAVYLLALCAGREDCLPEAGPGLALFDDADESVYAHYYHEIRKNMAAGALLEERDREIGRLKQVQPTAAPWWRRLFGGR